jgi:hypothetical protein
VMSHARMRPKTGPRTLREVSSRRVERPLVHGVIIADDLREVCKRGFFEARATELAGAHFSHTFAEQLHGIHTAISSTRQPSP